MPEEEELEVWKTSLTDLVQLKVSIAYGEYCYNFVQKVTVVKVPLYVAEASTRTLRVCSTDKAIYFVSLTVYKLTELTLCNIREKLQT